MATQKALRFLYQAKNSQTGLTDVKAQVYLNGVAKAVAGAAIAAVANANGSKVTELDPTNAPGIYEVLLTAADLTAWGVTQTAAAYLEVEIDSASKSAPAPFRQQVTLADLDDIDVKLGTPAGASISADIAAVKSDTSAIKVDLETGPANLANILAAIQAVQNNAGFAIPVPSQMTIPASGSNLYRIPITIYDTNNDLVDPDSNSIVVGLVNQAGTDRGGFLVGSSGGPPLTVLATRDSLGQYHVDVSIPSTEVEEELLFSFNYAIGGKATARRATTVTLTEASTAGLALQSTLLLVKADIEDASTGLIPIKAAVDAIQADITTNVEGAGFSNTTDSLAAMSLFMRTYLYFGGRAV